MKNQIFESEYWRVELSEKQTYLGRSYVVCKTKRSSLSELTPEEFSDLHFVIKKYERLLKKSFNATLFNWGCLMNHAYRDKPYSPQVHFHVRPRYEQDVQIDGITFKDPNFGDHYHLTATMTNNVSEGVLSQILGILKNNL